MRESLLTPIWRLGGTYFASYVDGNGADEHTAATLDAAFLALLEADPEVGEAAPTWTFNTKKDRYKSKDRPTKDTAGTDRDRSKSDYADGADTKWEKDAVIGHWMGGVDGVWR